MSRDCWCPAGGVMVIPHARGMSGCAWEPLLNARVQFWVCPEHRGAPHRVEWRDDVAHCLTEGCGRTSQKPS